MKSVGMHIDDRTEIAQQAYAKASRFLMHHRQWERSVAVAVNAALDCARKAILDQGGQLDDFQDELGAMRRQLSAHC